MINILITGVVRNVSKNIIREVENVFAAFNTNRNKIKWLIIESDSSDNTLEKLKYLSKKYLEFRYESLGDLSSHYKRRTERISICRNAYRDLINTDIIYKDIDYVVVVDLDGMNNYLSTEGVESCFKKKDWDAVFANQLGPYYDIWALRHSEWSPNDCLKSKEFYEKYIDKSQSLNRAVFSKMINIPTNKDWIEVDSAFGGLGIYKKELFMDAEYRGIENNSEICEHVPFNLKLREHDYRLFINPKLINTDYTNHTVRMKNNIINKLKNIYIVLRSK